MERSDDEGIIDADSEDEVNDDESMEIDSYDEGDSDSESDSNDPWEDLRAEGKAMINKWNGSGKREHLERLLRPKLSMLY